jgi:hypothetical protein
MSNIFTILAVNYTENIIAQIPTYTIKDAKIKAMLDFAKKYECIFANNIPTFNKLAITNYNELFDYMSRLIIHYVNSHKYIYTSNLYVKNDALYNILIKIFLMAREFCFVSYLCLLVKENTPEYHDLEDAYDMYSNYIKSMIDTKVKSLTN